MASFISSNRRSSFVVLLIVFLILAGIVLDKNRVESHNIHRRFYRRAVRLCSRSLSDALYLLCKDRGGYNEPFSNSEETQQSKGPGLVEECCYNSCSIEQMEQYCKRNSTTPKNGQKR